MKTFFKPFMHPFFFVLLLATLVTSCQQVNTVKNPETTETTTKPETPEVTPDPTNPEIPNISEEEFKNAFLSSFETLYSLETNKTASQNVKSKLIKKGTIKENGLEITNISNISYNDKNGLISATFDGKILFKNSTQDFNNQTFSFSGFQFPFDDHISSLPSLKINFKDLFDNNILTKEEFIETLKKNNNNLITFENPENKKALLYNGTTINLFSNEQNYETKIKSIKEKNKKFEIEIEYNVFYHSKISNGENIREVVKKNSKTFAVDWYSESDIFDYILEDSNLAKNSIIDGYASEYYAKHWYQFGVNPIWSQFFNSSVLNDYKNKFSIEGTLIVAFPKEGIGANDVQGKLYINDYYITTQEYFEENNSGHGGKSIRSKN